MQNSNLKILIFHLALQGPPKHLQKTLLKLKNKNNYPKKDESAKLSAISLFDFTLFKS
jgi:hypothetical protein